MKLLLEKNLTTEEQDVIVKELAAGTKNKAEAIRALFAGGIDVKDIASITGIRYNHVYNVVNAEILLHNLDVERTDRAIGTKKAKIIAQLVAGKTITEIATATNSLYNYVWKIAKEAGFTRDKKVG